jgi:hypothetical protein
VSGTRLTWVRARDLNTSHVGQHVTVSRLGHVTAGGLSEVARFDAGEDRQTLVAAPGRMPVLMFGESPLEFVVLFVGGKSVAVLPDHPVLVAVLVSSPGGST